MSFRVLVLGLGSIGQRHVRNLRKLGVTDFLAVRSGLGQSRSREDGIIECRDIQAALAAHPDFALICTPTRFHLGAAVRLAEAGCPFFLEKPISDSMEGVQELAALVEERRIWTLVGFSLRFHPVLQRAKALMDSGGIGRPLHLRASVGQFLPDWHPGEDYRRGYSAQRQLGGGVVLDLIHEMDYAAWLVGPIREAICVADRVSSLEIDGEDVAEIVLRFNSGAIGSVHMDYLERAAHRTFRIVGEQGTIAGDILQNELAVFDASARSWHRLDAGRFERNDMYLDEMRHLLDCASGHARPLVDLAAAIPVHAITVGALDRCRAAVSGTDVTLERTQ